MDEYSGIRTIELNSDLGAEVFAVKYLAIVQRWRQSRPARRLGLHRYLSRVRGPACGFTIWAYSSFWLCLVTCGAAGANPDSLTALQKLDWTAPSLAADAGTKAAAQAAQSAAAGEFQSFRNQLITAQRLGIPDKLIGFVAALEKDTLVRERQNATKIEWNSDTQKMINYAAGGDMPLVQLEIGGRKILAGLDFGSGISVVDDRLDIFSAREKADIDIGTSRSKDSFGNNVGGRVSVASIEVGPALFPRQKVLVIDHATWINMITARVKNKRYTPRLEMLIGADILSRMRVVIDDDSRSVTLSKPQAAVPRRNVWWQGKLLIKCSVGNEPAILEFDTGANRSSVNTQFADTARIKALQKFDADVTTLAGRNRIQITEYLGFSCTDGDFAANIASPIGIDKASGYVQTSGALGADFLKGKRLSIDFLSGEFRIN